MIRTSLKLLGVLAIIGMFTLASATPVTLGWLIDNQGSLTIGDKTFTNFTGSIATSGGGSVAPADLSGINVTPVFQGGMYGLQLSGGISAACQENENCPTNIDLLVGWNVSAAPGFMITGVDLSFNGSTSNGPPSFAKVTETVFDVNSNMVLGQGVVTTGPPPALQSFIDLGGQYGAIRIQKDILVSADSFTNEDTNQVFAQADISQITQLYQQTIPEPGTYAMIGLGLAGLGFLRRRKA